MAADGIQVLAGASIGSVRHADGRFTVSLTDAGGTALELGSDRLLVAAGRRPNISDVGLDAVGLDPQARSVDTDARMRAGDKLWAIGDITGKGAFTHMSMYQASVALADITGRRDDAREAEYHAVPRVTFTDPEVGAVGLTEQQARDAGLDVARRPGPAGRVDPRLDHRARRRGPHQARRGPRGRPPRRRHVGRADGRRGALDARHRRARPRPHRHPGPDAVRLPDLPPRRRDGAGRPAGVAVDAAGRVRAAMATQPRERFLPASERRRASYDGPLDIGHGQTNSQPRTVRAMLELLDVRPGQRVLDVGSGSGWTTALLAELVGPTGSVLGLERVPDLVLTGARERRGGPDAVGSGPRVRRRGARGARGGAVRPGPGVGHGDPAARWSWSPSWGRHGILVVPVAGRMLRVVRDDTAPDGPAGQRARPLPLRARSSPTEPAASLGPGVSRCSGRRAARGTSRRPPCACSFRLGVSSPSSTVRSWSRMVNFLIVSQRLRPALSWSM